MSDTPSASPETPTKARRWLGPALLVSLVINFALLGMIATALISHRPPHREFGALPPPFFGVGSHREGRELPNDERATIRRIMVQQFPRIRPYVVNLEAAHIEVANAVGTTPYDAARVTAAFEKMDAAMASMMQAMRGAMVEGLGKLTPEQRQRLAESMRKQSERRLNRADRRGEPSGPDDDGHGPSDGPDH